MEIELVKSALWRLGCLEEVKEIKFVGSSIKVLSWLEVGWGDWVGWCLIVEIEIGEVGFWCQLDVSCGDWVG